MARQPDVFLLGFARALREAGVVVTQDRARTYLDAVSRVGAGDPQGTYWAGRATLCSSPDDTPRYDRVFESWFGEGGPDGRGHRAATRTVARAALDAEEGDVPSEAEAAAALASSAELLRHRDVAELSAGERARLLRMYGELRPRAPRRAGPRKRPARHGEVDARRTLRRMLAHVGEPAQVAWRRRAARPRTIVLLVDVSGSMKPYADAHLRLAHRMLHGCAETPRNRAPRPVVEVFTVGTRLTRVTRALRHRDAEQAIAAAGETVPDWSGGTRLGETLKAFLDRWGQRGMARGAVVVLFSDGWERGGADALAGQMRRLQHLAHRVVWVNPHRDKDGYAPVQAGMNVALPYVDHFLPGHSLATFANLTEVVARA